MRETEYGKTLRCSPTPIPGLTLWDLPVHGDNRGFFKENWQREKMIAAGLRDFRPVQNNVSFNDGVGTTRGIHAEPWDKFISVASGRIFGAWVDLRAGSTFGTVFTAEIDPSRSVFVPRGVGNAFQTLVTGTVYTYLVNAHYRPETTYTSLNLADETINIRWPIPLDQAQLSAKDATHPRLDNVTPVPARKTLVLGAEGQLGRALRKEFAGTEQIEFATRAEIDLRAGIQSIRDWNDYDTIVNAAAYTSVDGAETTEGRTEAWATNAASVASLARVATDHGLTLIHFSSDYVFDGTAMQPYDEDHAVSPLGVYGQTKAAGDQIVSTVPRHYIIRTSWVIGDGNNFVRTMLALSKRGISPMVVSDQFGRLTFTSDLARAVRHLLETCSPHGTYNVTSAGKLRSWADIARMIFSLAGDDQEKILEVSTAQYLDSLTSSVAPRPRYSALDLTKITATGFKLSIGEDALASYVYERRALDPDDARN